jgi:uncharacterized membrane-anchored protein YhcB (DUF1043 family)
MFGGIWVTILGLLSGLVSVFSKVMEELKKQDLKNQGKIEQQAEIAKDELEKTREQNEILVQDRTKEDVVKRLEDGTF